MKRFLDSRALWVAPAVAVAALYGLYTLGPSLLPPTTKQTAAVALLPQATTTERTLILEQPTFQFIEIFGGCDWSYTGECINMRSGPGTTYTVVLKLRDGMVLRVVNATTTEDGRTWYKIGFTREPRYPERKTSDWFVAGEYVRPFFDVGEQMATSGMNASSTKRITINLSEKMLRAYDDDTLFMEQRISPGLELTPTPRGTFWIYRKTPDSYMQGPLPGISDQYYDLPGVPWDLYFTIDGGAIHGTYWHNHFGQAWSHGCVNLPPDQAKILYEWADLGTPVIVK